MSEQRQTVASSGSNIRLVTHESRTLSFEGRPTWGRKHVGGYRVNRGKSVEVSPVFTVFVCGFVRVRDRQSAARERLQSPGFGTLIPAPLPGFQPPVPTFPRHHLPPPSPLPSSIDLPVHRVQLGWLVRCASSPPDSQKLDVFSCWFRDNRKVRCRMKRKREEEREKESSSRANSIFITVEIDKYWWNNLACLQILQVFADFYLLLKKYIKQFHFYSRNWM